MGQPPAVWRQPRHQVIAERRGYRLFDAGAVDPEKCPLPLPRRRKEYGTVRTPGAALRQWRLTHGRRRPAIQRHFLEFRPEKEGDPVTIRGKERVSGRFSGRNRPWFELIRVSHEEGCHTTRDT